MDNFRRPEDALKPQAVKVLGMLRTAGDAGVSNGDFIRSYIERFGGRICEMRKLGWEIETKRVGQGKARYILRAEPAGVGAEVLGPVGTSTDSGGSPVVRPESDREATAGLGGHREVPVGGGSLFDADQFTERPGYGDAEMAA